MGSRVVLEPNGFLPSLDLLHGDVDDIALVVVHGALVADDGAAEAGATRGGGVLRAAVRLRELTTVFGGHVRGGVARRLVPESSLK